MKDTGRVEIRCKCPFCDHGHGNPAASINKDKGLFYCYRCGEGFNAVSLYAKVYGMDTKTAYKELLDIAA
jgi:DNA primase